MGLVTTAEVKTYLKITGATQDAFLADLITKVTSIIESYCDQPIVQIGKTETSLLRESIGYDNDTQQNIYNDNVLFTYSVPTSVTKIEYTIPFENSYTELATTEYEVYYDGWTLKIWFRNGYSTTYTWKVSLAVGYDANSIPEDIQQVAIEMVAMKFKESVQGENILGKSTVSDSQSGATANTNYKNMWIEWKKVLDHYKKPSF